MTYRIRNLAVAVGLALVAMLLTLLYVTNYKRSVRSDVSTVQVYVAAQDLAAGTPGAELAREGIRLAEVPRESVVPGAISNPAEVRDLVLAAPLYTGEQVTTRRFADVAAQGVRSKLRGTARAVQIAGDRNQVLQGTLEPGDRVDLVASMETTPGSDAKAARIVLRDLAVLAIPDAPTGAGVTSSSSSAVVLAVSDTQVQRLLYVVRNADWTLELRPVVDPADSPERVETLDSILLRGVR